MKINGISDQQFEKNLKCLPEGPRAQFLDTGCAVSLTLCIGDAGGRVFCATMFQSSHCNTPFQSETRTHAAGHTFHVNLKLESVHPEDLQVLHDYTLSHSCQLKWQGSRQRNSYNKGCYGSLVSLRAFSTHCNSFWCCRTVSLCRRSKLYFSSVACYAYYIKEPVKYSLYCIIHISHNIHIRKFT